MLITKGDLVKPDPWIKDGVLMGKVGVVVEVQSTDYCIGAYVMFDKGIELIRIENLKVIP